MRLGNLIISYVMSTSPYMLNLGSLAHPHGLEEAHVVHRPDPGHLGQVGEAGRTHLMPIHVQYSSPHLLNLGSLSQPHGLEEGPEVH